MLTKKIKYTDYNGDKREETHYFNLSKAEVLDLESEGFLDEFALLAKSDDLRKGIKLLKQLIAVSYGKKSPDGTSFTKDPELFKEFSYTEAYSELFMEILSNVDAAMAFIKGVFPADMTDGIEGKIAELNTAPKSE